MNTFTIYRIGILIFLTLCAHTHPSYAQTTQRASVVSSAGGQTVSGTFENFGVLGESIVSSQFGDGIVSGQAGYIYMTTPNEPYYIGRNDSLILVDIYTNMGGKNWFVSWDLTTPVIKWKGVEVAYGSVLSVNLNQNNLTGTLPNSVKDFSRINESNFSINIGDNKLDFESAEDFVKSIALFSYSPQAKIYSSIDTTIMQSESITFNSTTRGDFNRYQWFKDNSVLVGKTDSILTIKNALPSDAGEYFCKITNTQATKLTLERHTITLNVEGFLDLFDSLALVKLYQETGGISWIKSWNLNNPVSTWEGVTLKGNKVIELDLSNRNLVGKLPDIFDAALFSELRYLSFFNNNLEGQIPVMLGEITALTYLDLDKNKFEGAVPSSFGKLINLQALWLSRNNLTSLPNEIGKLINLKNLYLNDNKFTSLPSTLGDLIELLVLNISDNELSEFPNSITNLIKLRELYANRNFIATLPPTMNSLVALTIFEMNTNKLVSIPIQIQQLSNLKVFRIAENSLEFDDLLPYANRNLQIFDYSPQAPINEEQDILITISRSISFKVETQGIGNIYQWKKDDQNVYSFQTLTLNRVAIADAGMYTAFVTNPALPNLTLERRKIILNVECGQDLGFKLQEPQQTIFCEAQPFALSLEISSDFAGISQVRWRKDGIVLAFARGKNYTVTTAGKYTAEVTTAGGCVARSNEVEITTLPQPEVSIDLRDNSIFTSSVKSAKSVKYQWLRNGDVIENAFQDSYIPTETGEYSLLILSEAGCSSVSQSIIFTRQITAIEEPIELRGINLFPNPNNGIFFLDFGANSLNGTPKFILIDAIGREINLKIERISSTSYKIYADKIKGGMYQLKIQTLDGAALRKFVLSE